MAAQHPPPENGEKLYEMYSDSVQINKNLKDDPLCFPPSCLSCRPPNKREHLRTEGTLSTSRRGRRALEPPRPFVLNARENIPAPLGRWNLYIGGAGRTVPGYVNLDLIPMPGVDIAADAAQLPFPSEQFQRVECDAVLEHVRDPGRVVGELCRVLAPGGYLHLVTPFCHPFHEYPGDYHRFTPDGLRQLVPGLEVVAEGWRTGPTATCWSSSWSTPSLLPGAGGGQAPLRARLDASLRPRHPITARGAAGRIGNHCYLGRKPAQSQTLHQSVSHTLPAR